MIVFDNEVQGGKQYLVYRKNPEDNLDMVSIEMMLNNKIDGTVPFSCVQIDDAMYMKYDITGLKSLQEFLSGIVGRDKLLTILENFIDVWMSSEDYMLETASYVLDPNYIFVNPDNMKIQMMVLPVFREAVPVESFLQKLLLNVQYDQREDCSYVAALVNCFGTFAPFSMTEFKTLVHQHKTGKPDIRKIKKISETFSPQEGSGREGYYGNFSEYPNNIPVQPIPPVQPMPSVQPIPPVNPNVNLADAQQDVADPSGHPSKKSKERKGLFRKNEKKDKKEKPKKDKKGLFKKDKQDEDPAKGRGSSPWGDILIPGQIPRNPENRILGTGHDPSGNSDMIIPGQPINIENRPVEKQDFGTTVYSNEEGDAPTVLQLADTVPARHFVLYRCRTKETYDITKEVTRIGRNPKATDFCVSGNDGVGRVHAIIRVIDQKVYIEDNCSKNGTFVNGVRIQPGMGPYFLENGAKIRLSDEELEFHVYN